MGHNLSYISLYFKIITRSLHVKDKSSKVTFFIGLFLLLILLALSGFAIMALSEETGWKPAVYLATHSWRVLYITIIMGLMVGVSWFRFGDRMEVEFLLGLPLPRRKVAEMKIVEITLELFFVFILLLSLLLIAGFNVLHLVLYMNLFLLSLAGIFSGLLLVTLPYIYRPLSRVLPYLTSLLFFYLFVISEGDSRLYNIYLQQGFLILVGLVIILLIMVRLLSFTLPFLFERQVVQKVDKKTVSITVRRDSYYMALFRKDLLHYYREGHQLIQVLLIIVVLVLLLARTNWFDQIGLKLVLFSIPFIFSGQITLHLIGLDGALLSLLKMLKGTLKHYYNLRFLISWVVVLIPSFISYILLALLYYREALALEYLLLLFLLIPIYVSMALGFSVLFVSYPRSHYLPGRGISLMGEFLYWLLGVNIPTAIALWSPHEVYLNIFLGFIAILSLIIALGMGVYGYHLIDKVVE